MAADEASAELEGFTCQALASSDLKIEEPCGRPASGVWTAEILGIRVLVFLCAEHEPAKRR
jgi:hypothetical protein